MARRRDHAAEYRAAKARAQAAGFASQREMRAVRRQLRLPVKASPAPRRILAATAPEHLNAAQTAARARERARNWSRKHSRKEISRYKPSMTDEQVEAYNAAFIDASDRGHKRRRWDSWRYFQSMGWTRDEWLERYGPHRL